MMRARSLCRAAHVIESGVMPTLYLLAACILTAVKLSDLADPDPIVSANYRPKININIP